MVKGCFCFDLRPGSLIVVWIHIILATLVVVGGFYYAAVIHVTAALALGSIHMVIAAIQLLRIHLNYIIIYSIYQAFYGQ